MTNRDNDVHTVEEMYEHNDLSKCSLFVGGYINFGIYVNFDQNKEMSYNERLDSEKKVYLVIAEQLQLNENSIILDVACGKGLGTTLIYETFRPKCIYGIDLPNQIKRANLSNPNNKAVIFTPGLASQIPFENSYFNGISCIGGLIYFEKVKSFFEESYRVLKPNGKLSIATYLGISPDSKETMKNYIPPIKEGYEYVYDHTYLKNLLKKTGFRVSFQNIGKNVFFGFDKWVSQTAYKGTWSENWLKSYKHGLIDYFLILAEKKG